MLAVKLASIVPLLALASVVLPFMLVSVALASVVPSFVWAFADHWDSLVIFSITNETISFLRVAADAQDLCAPVDIFFISLAAV